MDKIRLPNASVVDKSNKIARRANFLPTPFITLDPASEQWQDEYLGNMCFHKKLQVACSGSVHIEIIFFFWVPSHHFFDNYLY